MYIHKYVCPAMFLALFAWGAQAQMIGKPVRLVVPFAAGGITDLVGRQISASLSQILGQSVFVDNRAGAGGAIGAEAVAKSAPDGRTLLLASSSTLCVMPHLTPVRYDPLKDFSYLASIGTTLVMLAAHPSVPAANLSELVAYAKAHPGKLRYGSSGSGGVMHLFGESFRLETATDIVHVPYKGAAPALNDVVAGHIELLFDSVSAIAPQVKAGKLRAIAMLHDKWDGLPNVPSLRSQGVQLPPAASFGIAAPANLPEPVKQMLIDALNKAVRDPAMLAQLEKGGLVPKYSTGADYEKGVREEHRMFGEVIRHAGIKLD